MQEPFAHKQFLHTERVSTETFTHRMSNEQKRLHSHTNREASTLNTAGFTHRNIDTHRRLYKQERLRIIKRLSRTEVFGHKRAAHTNAAFAHSIFYTQNQFTLRTRIAMKQKGYARNTKRNERGQRKRNGRKENERNKQKGKERTWKEHVRTKN